MAISQLLSTALRLPPSSKATLTASRASLSVPASSPGERVPTPAATVSGGPNRHDKGTGPGRRLCRVGYGATGSSPAVRCTRQGLTDVCPGSKQRANRSDLAFTDSEQERCKPAVRTCMNVCPVLDERL